MNRGRFAAALLLSLSLVACGGGSSSQPPAAPQQQQQPATTTTTAGVKAPGEAVVGDKTTCPVSGEEFVVTASSPKVEHNGKTYYFCCGGCDQRFAKDPEKYLQSNKSAVK